MDVSNLKVADLKTLTDCRAAATALRAEEQRIIAESTEMRLANNRQSQRDVAHRGVEIQREISNAKKESKPGKRETELMEQIKIARDREAIVRNDFRGIPQQYITANAVADGEAELAAQKAKIDAARPKNTDFCTLSPRLKTAIREYEVAESEWKLRSRKLAEAGQKIHEIREDIRVWTEELDQLRNAREARAVELAGLSEAAN